MRQFLTSIEASLKSENWLAALSTTLTIPDMAGWAQYPQLRSGERYKLWFTENLAARYTMPITEPEMAQAVLLSEDDCWAFRCSFLHQGLDDLTGHASRKKLDRFAFCTTGNHCNRIEGILVLDIETFCREFMQSAESWLDRHEADADIGNRLKSMLQVHTGPFMPVYGIGVG